MVCETIKEAVEGYGTITISFEQTDAMLVAGLEALEKGQEQCLTEAELVLYIFDAMMLEGEIKKTPPLSFAEMLKPHLKKAFGNK